MKSFLYIVFLFVFVYASNIDEVVNSIDNTNIKLKKLNYNVKSANENIENLNNNLEVVNTDLIRAKEHLKSQKSKFIKLINEAVLLNFSQYKRTYNTQEDSFITKVFFDEYIKQNINNLNYLNEDIKHIKNSVGFLAKEYEQGNQELLTKLDNKQIYDDLVFTLEELNAKLDVEENRYAKQLINSESQKQTLIHKLNELEVLNEKYLNCFLKYSKGVQKAISLISKDHKYFRNRYKYKKSKQIKSLVSYKRRCRINSYKKEKTIAPLNNSVLSKPFGPLKDQYNLNIYNYSIELSVNELDNKLFNILNGQIEFIGSVGEYENVMIIKHNNKLHSIYIGIDKLAPNIKVGSKIKKGTIIAKVKNSLTFQVIKGNRYINPLELIEL